MPEVPASPEIKELYIEVSNVNTRTRKLNGSRGTNITLELRKEEMSGKVGQEIFTYVLSQGEQTGLEVSFPSDNSGMNLRVLPGLSVYELQLDENGLVRTIITGDLGDETTIYTRDGESFSAVTEEGFPLFAKGNPIRVNSADIPRPTMPEIGMTGEKLQQLLQGRLNMQATRQAFLSNIDASQPKLPTSLFVFTQE